MILICYLSMLIRYAKASLGGQKCTECVKFITKQY